MPSHYSCLTSCPLPEISVSTQHSRLQLHTIRSFKSLCLHMQFFQPGQLSSSFVLKSHPSSRPSSKVTWMWHLPWPNLHSPCCLSSPACFPAERFVQATITPLVSGSCLSLQRVISLKSVGLIFRLTGGWNQILQPSKFCNLAVEPWEVFWVLVS